MVAYLQLAGTCGRGPNPFGPLGMAGEIIRAVDVAIDKPGSYAIPADGLGSEQLHKDITRSEDIVWMKTSKCESSYEVSYMPTTRLTHIETHSMIISPGKYVPISMQSLPMSTATGPVRTCTHLDARFQLKKKRHSWTWSVWHNLPARPVEHCESKAITIGA